MVRRSDVDGGWAYVVGFGVFISFFLIGGFAQGFGILYAAFIDTFDQTDSVTSLLVGVRCACMVVSGPLSTVLSERYTERKVAIAGALITSLAFSLSFFATTLQFLVVTIGAILGIGMSILIGPSNVAMGNYFDKKRSRAMTVTSCGGCIGMMVVPILLQKLVEHYSVRGALLIFGALSLHLILTGAFFRPLRADYKHRSRETFKLDQMETLPTNSCENDVIKGHKSNELQPELEIVTITKAETNITPKKRTFPMGDEGSLRVSVEDGKAPMLATKTETSLNRGLDENELPVIRTKLETKGKRKCNDVFMILLGTFDFSLLKKPIFLPILTSAMLSCIPYFTMTIFFVPFMESHDISRDMAAILLSVMGGCDIVGRLICGAAADRKPLQPNHVIVFTSILAGIFCSLLVVVSGFFGFMGVVIAYSLVYSAPNVLILPATVHLLGLAHLPKAVGALMFFVGLSSSVAPSLLGLLKDYTGSYGSVFLVLGGIHVVAGLILMTEPLVRRMSLRHDAEPIGAIRNHSEVAS